MIGVQQYAGSSLGVLGRLARGHTKSANLLPGGLENSLLVGIFPCLEKKLVGILLSPVEEGL